jgi:hypothetical protein
MGFNLAFKELIKKPWKKENQLEKIGVYGRVMELSDIKIDDVGCIKRFLE